MTIVQLPPNATPRHELLVVLSVLRRALHDEVDTQPGTQRIHGRLHDSGRVRYLPRYSPSGDKQRGSIRIAADCTDPDHGRCTHNDGGSWRPVPGTPRSDSLAKFLSHDPNAGRLTVGALEYSAAWSWDTYELDPSDALWYCRWPHRRALDRLRSESMRRYLVLQRLLGGASLREAWDGLGTPADPVGSALAIARQVDRMAREEAQSAYERRPRNRVPVGWIDKSDAQQTAELAAEAS
jgi:hypothetical protein